MNSIYFDSTLSDEVRRTRLYEGELFVYSPCSSSLALCQFAREMIEEEFASRDALTAQHSLPVADYAAILSRLKPKFIHHPKSKLFIQGILKERGCDLDKTYFDVPRMRSSTSDNYLTTGIAYAFHPHRDTWYSAPHAQLNWWLPIYEVESANVMAFHSMYWGRPVKNSSSGYNYYQCNATSRKEAAKHVKQDTRTQPQAGEALEPYPQCRVVLPSGGVLIFSGAHLHSTGPNTSGKTRFSIDFRTVNLSDLTAARSAPNVDAACTGTTLRDYLRASDLAHV